MKSSSPCLAVLTVVGFSSSIIHCVHADFLDNTAASTRFSALSRCAFVAPLRHPRRVLSSCSGRLNGVANANDQNELQEQEATIPTTASSSSSSTAAVENSAGLYRPFAEHAWKKLLQDTDWFEEDLSIPDDLTCNTAPAKGLPEGAVVRMTTRALRPTQQSSSLVRYARYALLETLVVPPEPLQQSSCSYNSTVGIQVLNLVIFPAASTNLPVFGADLVSLPGNRHLLLLDAQPMDLSRSHQDAWKGWHQEHVVGPSDDKNQKFAWGGDIPEQVARYVSDYALWTRLVAAPENSNDNKDENNNDKPMDPVAKIQTHLWDAYKDHLDLYLQLLADFGENGSTSEQKSSDEENEQEPYIRYRLQNDPARPMLKSLYGEEWTERVLQEVLFPKLQST